jgi:hypothetical protein
MPQATAPAVGRGAPLDHTAMLITTALTDWVSRATLITLARRVARPPAKSPLP